MRVSHGVLPGGALDLLEPGLGARVAAPVGARRYSVDQPLDEPRWNTIDALSLPPRDGITLQVANGD